MGLNSRKSGKGDQAKTVRVDAQLARSLFKLATIANVWPASILLVLAILEVLAVSRGASAHSACKRFEL